MLLNQNMKFAFMRPLAQLDSRRSATAAMIAAGCVTAASLNCHQTETMRL
jgi:hypothetical protein